MKKILFIVGEEFSANGICALAVMDELKNNGFDVKCITNQEYNTQRSETINGIEFHRIKPRLTYRIINWCNNHPGKITWILRKIAYILNKIKLIISIPSWPLISPLYTLRFYRTAKNLYNKENFDCIIPIYSQIDTVITGNLIKRRFPGVKFVPYFLDSLSGGYGPKIFSRDWVIKRGLKWERRLLKNADKIIVMESSKIHHEEYSKYESYYSRIKILDIPLLNSSFKFKKKIPTSFIDTSKVNIVYVGSIPIHIRNPAYILEIFRRLKMENIRLTIIGRNTCPELISRAQKESIRNEIIVIDQILHDEVISVLKNSDVLLNIGNNIKSMVPSKIFEYMSIGKPILSTYPIENEPSLKYLGEYPASLAIKEAWDKIDENVALVENFIKDSVGKQIDFNEIKQRMYHNTPIAFVNVIKELLK